MTEGAVDQGQGHIILVYGIRADMPCFQVAPLVVIPVYTTKTVPHSQTHQCPTVLWWSSVLITMHVGHMGFYNVRFDLDILACIRLWIQLDSMKLTLEETPETALYCSV